MIKISAFVAVFSIGLATAVVPTIAADSAEEASAPVFDMGIALSGVTDYMDSGFTNSNHKPSFSLSITPSYGIFYGEFYIANIDYGTTQPKFEARWSAGATPEFGNLAVDFNLERKIKYNDPSYTRWLPYVTATYSFNDNFSASLGGGYYFYDHDYDFGELYVASTYTFDNGAYVTGETYWEPSSDADGNDYYGIYGTVSVPFAEKFEAVGKLGYEGYQDKGGLTGLESYTWYEAGLNYSFNDHVVLGVGYHGSSLSDASGCGGGQQYTDCQDRFFAKLTLKTNWSDLFKSAE